MKANDLRHIIMTTSP